MLTKAQREEALGRVETLIHDLAQEFSIPRTEVAVGLRSVVGEEWFKSERSSLVEKGESVSGARPHK